VPNPEELGNVPNELALRPAVKPYRLFFHLGDRVHGMIVTRMTVQGRMNAEKELKYIAEIVTVVAVESVGAVVDGDLCAEADVEAVAE
jgi:hypothetical protein